MKKIFIFFIIFLSFVVYSQEKKSKTTEDYDEIIETFIEEISANTDKEIDYTSLYEDLVYFLDNPLNLNTATKEDLEKLQILSDFQIQSLLNYINEYGYLYTIYELLNINGFNSYYVQTILPFITVELPAKKFDLQPQKLKYGRHKIFIRTQRVLQQQEGFKEVPDSVLIANPNSHYLGDPMRYYLRYNFTYKNRISVGFTAEKDPGEEFFKGTQKRGFDFYSAHLLLKKIGPIKTFVIGDYYAQFGQGLILWPGYIFGKSSMVNNVRRKSQGLKKYSSTDENMFFRGSGITLNYKNIDLTTFYSNKNIDANITKIDTLTGEAEMFSSFLTSGLHSIPSEIEDRKSVNEKIFGGNITYNHKYLKIGCTGLYYKYSASLNKAPSIYNKFEFSGNENINASLDYNFIIRNSITFFGEAGISKNGGKGIINGILFSLSPLTNFAILYRNIEKNFQALYGQPFSESSSASNESGLYIGASIVPLSRWNVSAYYDIFRFPWLKYQIYSPSAGYDYLIEVSFTPNRKVNTYFRYREKNKPQNISSELNQDLLYEIENTCKKNYRFHISYKVLPELELRNRIEYVNYITEQKSESGIYIYQDAIYKMKKLPLNIAVRYGIFDTDSYDTRIYAYENDILYAFGIPPVYYKGTRFYITLKYTIIKNLDIWLRYGEFYYSNKQIISSGLTQINGNVKSEFKLQLRYTF
ncbi:MAG: helix-hairpin-helix domain-containing protein [Bacteroidales bacterium]|nr:helix-hairpin-helix domain-containing protein [Bacteroidales bacterium]